LLLEIHLTFLIPSSFSSLSLRDTDKGYEIAATKSLLYDLSTIKNATENFSEANRLGEGGFGVVHQVISLIIFWQPSLLKPIILGKQGEFFLQGKLEDGQEIAVKKLLTCSSQGIQELKNEVVLLVKLQHRNLVKLLGFCFEGEEKMLVYEYMHNKSLDGFLFGM
jgi:serine/threonine protein kinase